MTWQLTGSNNMTKQKMLSRWSLHPRPTNHGSWVPGNSPLPKRIEILMGLVKLPPQIGAFRPFLRNIPRNDATPVENTRNSHPPHQFGPIIKPQLPPFGVSSKKMAENVIQTRSSGAAVEGIKDQYADGKAAKVWEVFIGDKNSRTQNYKNFLVGLLKKKGCRRILDVACGTGIDSVMLLEEGFEVVSVDASDKMLKHALKARWNRRGEFAFYNWVIEEANWVSLYEDIEHLVGNGFDAVICLGNSFAHLLDSFGDQREQKQAIKNFEKCVKPGGLLLIDHRNYDDIINAGSTPSKCIYYNSKHMTDIKTSVLFVAGKAALVTLDYFIDTSPFFDKGDTINFDYISKFRLSYYPHKLEVFKNMLAEAFGQKSKYHIYGDFKSLEEIENPAFYIHVVEKAKRMF